MASDSPDAAVDVSPSSHRLPTVSASDALRNLRDAGNRTISTGLPALDRILVGQALSTFGHGGLVRGQLTEVYGPPGCGKTAFCMQAAGSVLNGSGHVVWVDCAFPVPISRIISLSDQQEALSTRFHHFQTPGLPQVLALFHRQKAGFPPEKTSLLIIDNVSSVFPLPGARQPGATPSNSTRSPSTIFRSTFLASLTRIASSHNIAIVLTSDATTRFRYESKAMLVGSMGGKEWEEPLSSRIALFREFPPQSLPHENILEQHNDMLLDRLRYAGVMKANGIITVENDAFRDVVPFTISNSGTILPVAFPTPSSAPVVISPPAAVLKRRIGEVPDSEEEDWDAEVESLDGQDFEDPEDEIQILQAELPVTAELEDRSKRSKPSDGND